MPTQEATALLAEIGSELQLSNLFLEAIHEDLARQASATRAIAATRALPPRDPASGRFTSSTGDGGAPSGPGGGMIVEGRLASTQRDMSRAQDALDDFSKGLDIIPGQFRAMGVAAQTASRVVQIALTSTGIGAIVVALGALVAGLAAAVTMSYRLGASFKEQDIQLASVSFNYRQLERDARFALVAVGDVERGRDLTLSLANAAEEAAYRFRQFGEVNTQALIAASAAGLDYFKLIEAQAQGTRALIDALPTGFGDTEVEVRQIRDALGISLEEAGIVALLNTGNEQQREQAERLYRETQVINEREREAARTTHTDIQEMAVSIKDRLIPLTQGILNATELLLKFFTGRETTAERNAREAAAEANVAQAYRDTYLDGGAGPVPTAGRPYQQAVEAEAQRLSDSRGIGMDILNAAVTGNVDPLVDNILTRAQGTTAPAIPHAAAIPSARDIAQATGAPASRSPADFIGNRPTVTQQNTYNITGTGNLEEAVRIAEESATRQVGQLTK